MSAGEMKARKAKREMTEGELAFGDFDCEEIYQPWFAILGLDPRRQYRFDESG